MIRRIARSAIPVGAATIFLSGIATAHVDYVVDADPETIGEAIQFVITTMSDPLNAVLLAVGAVGLVGLLAGWILVRPFPRDIAEFRATMKEYTDLVPWLLRIGIGFPLVGAGFAGYYFSPAVPIEARLLQIGIGFLLLFGLATRAVAAIGLVAYVVGLVVDPRILLANEFVGGFLAIILLGAGRPSADDVLQRVAEADSTVYGRIDPIHRIAVWFQHLVVDYKVYLPTLLRVSLGLNFVYLGFVQKLMSPQSALAVVDKYNLTVVVPAPPELWVVGAGVTEIAVGIVLLLGLFTRGFSLVAFLLFTTTLFGLPDDPVLAHLSLYGLVSVLLITGSGPLALDNRLQPTETDSRRPSMAD
ncbi:DoxX family protein [Halomarina litorea]|uniref:DoxX family protein n=1 Tax=Halomarina litorea TaxID=2961595 RepID=UPI0020C5A689|nr:DoxX family protein [Halomarina sp. BCD28]